MFAYHGAVYAGRYGGQPLRGVLRSAKAGCRKRRLSYPRTERAVVCSRSAWAARSTTIFR
jgi:hypothetical protein